MNSKICNVPDRNANSFSSNNCPYLCVLLDNNCVEKLDIFAVCMQAQYSAFVIMQFKFSKVL